MFVFISVYKLSKKVLDTYFPQLISEQTWMYIDFFLPILIPSNNNNIDTNMLQMDKSSETSSQENDSQNFNNILESGLFNHKTERMRHLVAINQEQNPEESSNAGLVSNRIDEDLSMPSSLGGDGNMLSLFSSFVEPSNMSCY